MARNVSVYGFLELFFVTPNPCEGKAPVLLLGAAAGKWQAFGGELTFTAAKVLPEVSSSSRKVPVAVSAVPVHFTLIVASAAV